MDSTSHLALLERLPPWQWPEDARDLLLAILEDEKSPAEDLQRAAVLAGEMVVIDDGVAAALLGIATDAARPAALRARAASAFGMVLESMNVMVDVGADDAGGLVDPDADGLLDLDETPLTLDSYAAIRAALRRLHADESGPPELRRAALEASARAPEDWHAGAVRRAYADADAEWRRSAVHCMISVRGFDAEILAALAEPTLEHAAVVAAGSWGLADAWDHIASLVERPTTDRELLIAAIGALPHIDPESAIEVLDALEYADEDEAVDAAISEAEAVISGRIGSFADEGEPEDGEDW